MASRTKIRKGSPLLLKFYSFLKIRKNKAFSTQKDERQDVDVVQCQPTNEPWTCDFRRRLILDVLVDHSTAMLLEDVKELSWCRSAILDHCDAHGLKEMFEKKWAEGRARCTSFLKTYKPGRPRTDSLNLVEAWHWGSTAPGYHFGPWERVPSERLLSSVYFLSFACTGAVFICRKRMIAAKAASMWEEGEDLYLFQKYERSKSDGESSQSSLEYSYEAPIDHFRNFGAA